VGCLRLAATLAALRCGEEEAEPPPAVAPGRRGRAADGGRGAREGGDGGELSRQRRVAQRALELGLSYLRDLSLLASGCDAELVHNQDRREELIDLSRRLTPDAVLDGFAAIREALQLLERNVSPLLTLERMFFAVIAGAIPPELGLLSGATFRSEGGAR
jgi:hypothetical protein